MLVIDHLVARGRIVLELDPSGARRRLARVTISRIERVLAPVADRALVEALWWLCFP